MTSWLCCWLATGTFRGGQARFNIPGPDLSPADMDDLLDGLGQRRITFVNTATASGAFVEALSAPGRTIITATRSGREQNMTRFGLHFVDAFADEGADIDKDERVSMLEAFGYALAEVEREYEGDNQLLTEHAMLDDNGDGEGSRELDELDGDGALARVVFLRSLGGAGGGEAVSPELRAPSPGKGGDRGADRGPAAGQGAAAARALRGRAGGAARGAGAQEQGDSGGEGERVGRRAGRRYSTPAIPSKSASCVQSVASSARAVARMTLSAIGKPESVLSSAAATARLAPRSTTRPRCICATA